MASFHVNNRSVKLRRSGRFSAPLASRPTLNRILPLWLTPPLACWISVSQGSDSIPSASTYPPTDSTPAASNHLPTRTPNLLKKRYPHHPFAAGPRRKATPVGVPPVLVPEFECCSEHALNACSSVQRTLCKVRQRFRCCTCSRAESACGHRFEERISQPASSHPHQTVEVVTDQGEQPGLSIRRVVEPFDLRTDCSMVSLFQCRECCSGWVSRVRARTVGLRL